MDGGEAAEADALRASGLPIDGNRIPGLFDLLLCLEKVQDFAHQFRTFLCFEEVLRVR